MPTLRSSAPSSPSRIAVIGGGLAGVACAARLSAAGQSVTVFDKGRTPGGRMATRRVRGWQFDHGAQYFTARDARFAAQVERWHAGGLVEHWTGHTVTLGTPADERSGGARHVGVPGMNAIGQTLAKDLDVLAGVRVAGVHRTGATWSVSGDDGTVARDFDQLVIAVPAPQAVDLLEASPALADAAGRARYAPCQALMLGLDAPLPVRFDAACVAGGALGWIARDASKPGRSGAESWVAHATAAWSTAHLEDAPEAVQASLLEALATALDLPSIDPAVAVVHRWRYALVTDAVGAPCLFDPAIGLGACGDWCLGGRVEAAWLSGTGMADTLLGGETGRS